MPITGYQPSNFLNKFRRNLRLLEKQEKANHIGALTYYYLSSTHSNLGDCEQAIKYALLALKEPGFEKTVVAPKPYVILAKNMLTLEDKYTLEEVESYIDKALELYPDHPEIWRMKAIIRKKQNKIHEAISCYNKALQCNQNFNHKMQNDFPMCIEEVYHDLAHLSQADGKTPDAVEYYYDALKINKYNGNTLASLYDLIKDQKTEEILLFLNSIYNRDDEKDLAFLISCMNQLNTEAAMYYYNRYEKTFSQKANLLS